MMYCSKEIAEILNCRDCQAGDSEIAEVSVDSRSVNKPGSTLFFALKGVNHDGHDYVKELYGRGVRHFVVDEKRKADVYLEGACFYAVPDVLAALQRLAAWHRKHAAAEVAVSYTHLTLPTTP